MTVFAKIFSPGSQTSIQDAGRFGVRHLGMPQSGAADRLSFAFANMAAGNHWNTPALECTLTGPVIGFLEDATFAICGAQMDATLDNAAIPMNTACEAKAGAALKLGAAKIGARAYIAFAGGLRGDHAFGSASTFAPAGIGGHHGRILQSGDALAIASAPLDAPTALSSAMPPKICADMVLRVTPGPEWKLFSQAARAAFLSTAFTVSPRANRIGLELNGAAITPPENFTMASSAVFPGVIQCPPSGDPFLLSADAQTTGGYARIGHVIDSDMHLAGQARPGSRIWFHKIDTNTARKITAQKNALYAAIGDDFTFG